MVTERVRTRNFFGSLIFKIKHPFWQSRSFFMIQPKIKTDCFSIFQQKWIRTIPNKTVSSNNFFFEISNFDFYVIIFLVVELMKALYAAEIFSCESNKFGRPKWPDAISFLLIILQGQRKILFISWLDLHESSLQQAISWEPTLVVPNTKIGF